MMESLLSTQTRELAITVTGISSSFGVPENKEKQKVLFLYGHIDESGDPTILKVRTRTSQLHHHRL